MTKQGLVAITGDQLAHYYFLNQLRSNFELSAIFIEKTRYPTPSFNSSEESEAWFNFFESRTKTEKKLLKFSKYNNIQNNPKIFSVEKGYLNDDKTIETISRFNPTKKF